MTEKEEKGVLALGMLILFVPMLIFNGWILTLMWDWFIVSAFSTEGSPIKSLTLIQAIGIDVIIGFLFHQYQWKGGKITKKMIEDQIKHIISKPLFYLAVAFVLSRCM